MNFRKEFSQFHGKIELCNLIRAIRNKVEREWQVFRRVEWLEGVVLGFGMVVEGWFVEFSAGVIFGSVHSGGTIEVAGLMMFVQLLRVFKMCPMGDFFIPSVIGTWVAGVLCCVFW